MCSGDAAGAPLVAAGPKRGAGFAAAALQWLIPEFGSASGRESANPARNPTSYFGFCGVDVSRTDSSGHATTMLARLRAGDRRAADELLPLVYDELHRLASHYLHGERLGHTLQTTALVHEAYLRLINQEQVQAVDRVHFVALAAGAMRRILVDHARSRRTAKRGQGHQRIPLDDAVALFETHSADLVALDDAVNELARANGRQGRVVELRFFGGLTADEVAEALGVSTRTVERDWRHARAWLYRTLGSGTGGN